MVTSDTTTDIKNTINSPTSESRSIRIYRNLCASRLGLHLALPRRQLPEIAQAVTHAEERQGAEIRIVIDVRLPIRDIFQGATARDSAVGHFSELRMWDSELRNGVLIYLLWAERRIEIVADRAAASAVPQHYWHLLCRGIEDRIHRANLKTALIFGVQAITEMLAPHFAPLPRDARKWSDEVILR